MHGRPLLFGYAHLLYSTGFENLATHRCICMFYVPSVCQDCIQSVVVEQPFETTAGYGKMPDYEHIFTDFLLSLTQSKHKKKPAT